MILYKKLQCDAKTKSPYLTTTPTYAHTSNVINVKRKGMQQMF
jgi:hypothetical protein